VVRVERGADLDPHRGIDRVRVLKEFKPGRWPAWPKTASRPDHERIGRSGPLPPPLGA
jgi:hypothetical protein